MLLRGALRWSATTADLVGRTLAERFDVLELIGAGGMGAVYRADAILDALDGDHLVEMNDTTLVSHI